MKIDEAFKRNTAISDCMGLVHSQKRRRKSASNGEKGRRSGFFPIFLAQTLIYDH